MAVDQGQGADRQQHPHQVAYQQGDHGTSRAQAPLRETAHGQQTQHDQHVLSRLQRDREAGDDSPRPALLEGRKAVSEDPTAGLAANRSHSAPVATPMASTSTVRPTVTGTRRANPNARRTHAAAAAPVPLRPEVGDEGTSAQFTLRPSIHPSRPGRTACGLTLDTGSTQ